MIYSVFVPTLPETALSPNARVHWRLKAKAVDMLRTYVSVYVLTDLRQKRWPGLPFAKVRIAIEYRVCRKRLGDDGFYRPADPDNALAALKPAIDGLVDASVIAGDRAENVSYESPQIVEVETRAEEGIAFHVEEVK